MPTHYIFDFGTIFDTKMFHATAICAVLKNEFNIDALPENIAARNPEFATREIFEQLTKKNDQKILDSLIVLKWEEMCNLLLKTKNKKIPYYTSMLATLLNINMKINRTAIVSSSPEKWLKCSTAKVLAQDFVYSMEDCDKNQPASVFKKALINFPNHTFINEIIVVTNKKEDVLEILNVDQRMKVFYMSSDNLTFRNNKRVSTFYNSGDLFFEICQRKK